MKILSAFSAALIKLVSVALLLQSSVGQAQPIALHPVNPHYFIYKNKPTILVTSGEHYGSVINRNFNYITYLDELQAHHLNLTRTFTGTYIEPPGAFQYQ